MPWKAQPLSSLQELKPYTNKNSTQYMKSNYLRCIRMDNYYNSERNPSF